MMKTSGMRARTKGGKLYTDYDKQDLSALADARRWLNSHGLRRFDLDEEERARRAEIYRRQLEATGLIEYLPMVPHRERRQPGTRFACGDALGRFGQASAR